MRERGLRRDRHKPGSSIGGRGRLEPSLLSKRGAADSRVCVSSSLLKEAKRVHVEEVLKGASEETLDAFGGRELHEKLRDITKGGVEEKGGLGLNRDA